MSRYFLHLKHADQSVIEDMEGLDLPSLQAAQEEGTVALAAIGQH